MSETERHLYVVNPDVSCREEGPDGALLFNPDTDQAAVVNPTGLLIWRVLKQPSDSAGVVAALVAGCDGVPEDAVALDVEEFLQEMVAKGFVGVYKGAAS